jgi:spiro-SPASM protein
MKRALVLHVDEGMNDDALSFADSFSPQIIADRLRTAAVVDGIFFSLPSTYSGVLSGKPESVVREGDDIRCWKTLVEKSQAVSLVRIYADAPFIDDVVVEEICSIHEKYLAEFTYSENVPAGLSCEVFSAELIKSLPETDEKRLPLSQVIRSNINQFDVELYYKAPDIRDKRLAFRSGDPRENRIMQTLFSRIGRYPKYEELKSLIEENGDVLYQSPSYLEVELTGNADVETIYSLRKGLKSVRGDMEPAVFSSIIEGIRTFDLPYSICLGGSGDPLCHPSFYQILDSIRNETLVKTIIIETDGTRCDADFSEYVSKANDSRITIIVDCSGYDAKSYSLIHESPRFDEILGNVKKLRDAMGDHSKNLHVQLMKIKETEPFIDAYYDMWEAEKVQIILQKHNSFLGAIEDRRYYDLTPLDRVPCWHLQRDLFVMADGRVGFCKQDINGAFSKWKISELSLQEIWKSRREIFMKDYSGKRATSPDCSKCDEWYTFNM